MPGRPRDSSNPPRAITDDAASSSPSVIPALTLRCCRRARPASLATPVDDIPRCHHHSARPVIARSRAGRYAATPFSFRMTLNRIFASASVVALIGCTSAAPATDMRSDIYAVYAAAIDSFSVPLPVEFKVAAQTRPHSLTRMLGDTTSLYQSVARDSGLSGELLADFERANAVPDSLCRCLPARLHAELQSVISSPSPKSPIVLSGVGFDRKRERAVVWIGQSCGPLCGSDILFLVVRRAGSWVVSRRLLTGAS